MNDIAALITDNLDIWASTIERKKAAGRGRGKSKKLNLYGVEKLRALILDLAVRGKLVPQDPDDEPASELLKRIKAEKAKLIAEKKIKKGKALPPIADEEKPFDLPQGWEWCRVTNAGLTFTGGTPKTSNSSAFEGNIPFIGPGQITPDGEIIEASKFLSEAGVLESTEAFSGDIVMVCIGGSIGKCAKVIERITFNQQINAVRPMSIVSEYLISVFRNDFFQAAIMGSATGSATPIINRTKWEKLPVPLSPLAEQKRIVAKVDELMALCDALEAGQVQAIEAHELLVKTLLATLVNSQNALELAENWSRISSHFHILFTTQNSITQLKQTILQLAVMGKLVPQDPNDEPASELLKRIKTEKAKLIAEKKIKKGKALPPVADEEKPFDLPDGWAWSRLEDLSTLITKGSSPKWQGVAYTENENDILFITSENVGKYHLLMDKKKYVERKFNDVEPRSILQNGDFLMNIVGASIGRTAIFDLTDDCNINQAVCLIRTVANHLNSNFLLHFFNSDVCISYMFDKQVDNARANLSMGNISKFVIPLPPLAEQKRIVARVDELMALCDQLISRITNANTLQKQLADTILKQATA